MGQAKGVLEVEGVVLGDPEKEEEGEEVVLGDLEEEGVGAGEAAREEDVEGVEEEEGWTKAAIAKMWKLDSFLRESQRYNGINICTCSSFYIFRISSLNFSMQSL